MKKYFNTILAASVLLLIFPFLAFPEIVENIYVAVLGFVVGYTSLLLRHKIHTVVENDEDVSLQSYVKNLKETFKKQAPSIEEHKTHKRVSDIHMDDEK